MNVKILHCGDFDPLRYSETSALARKVPGGVDTGPLERCIGNMVDAVQNPLTNDRPCYMGLLAVVVDGALHTCGVSFEDDTERIDALRLELGGVIHETVG